MVTYEEYLEMTPEERTMEFEKLCAETEALADELGDEGMKMAVYFARLAWKGACNG